MFEARPEAAQAIKGTVFVHVYKVDKDRDFAERQTPAEEDTVCSFELKKGRAGTERGASFGRSSKNAVPLSDSKVSRVHLRVDRDADGKVTAYDVGSRSGSFLNGKRFEAAAVHLRDQIRLGNSLLIFCEAEPRRKSIVRRMSDWMGFGKK